MQHAKTVCFVQIMFLVLDRYFSNKLIIEGYVYVYNFLTVIKRIQFFIIIVLMHKHIMYINTHSKYKYFAKVLHKTKHLGDSQNNMAYFAIRLMYRQSYYNTTDFM